MLRGSSFLLWKDYKFHKYAARTLLKPQFDILSDVNFDSPRATEAAIEPILNLVEELRRTYRDHAGPIDGRRRPANVSDTLATKIMLATLGCTPAYDWYFIEGMRATDIRFSELNAKHFRTLCDFYRENADTFKRVQRQIHESGIKYPAMRLVDMYFWEVGRLEAEKDVS
jgi:hypothetical protein